MRQLLSFVALLLISCPAAHALSEKDVPKEYPIAIEIVRRPVLTLLAIPGGVAAGARCGLESESDSTNDHIKLTPRTIPRAALGAGIGLLAGPLFTASTGILVH